MPNVVAHDCINYGTFNSLFEMPVTHIDDVRSYMFEIAFNSLFEMPTAHDEFGDEFEVLSILYLRCTDGVRRRHVLRLAWLSILYLRCHVPV